MNRFCFHAAIAALVCAALACGSPQREVSPTLPGASEADDEPPATRADLTATDGVPEPAADGEAQPNPWWDAVTLTCPGGTSLKKTSRGRYEAWCEKTDGKKHGPMASWVDEKVKYADATYVDDELDGTFTLWHTNGQKYLEFTYKAGKQDGPYKSWHTNGQLAEQGTNVAGKAHGRWEIWHANGNRAAAGEVAQGQRQGEWTLWGPEGDKLMVLTYRSDEIVAARRFKDGKPLNKSLMASAGQCDAVVTKIEQFAGPGAINADERAKIKGDCQKFMTGEEATCLANASSVQEMSKCLPAIATPGSTKPSL